MRPFYASESLLVYPAIATAELSPGPSLERRSMGSVVIFKESVVHGVPFFGEICPRTFFFSDVKLIPRTVETIPRNDLVCTVGQVHSAGPTLVQRTSKCHHRNQKDSSLDGITSRHPTPIKRGGTQTIVHLNGLTPRHPTPNKNKRGGTQIVRPSRSQRSQGCQRCGKARSGDPVTVARRTRRLRRRRAPIPWVDRRGGTGIPGGLKAKQRRRPLRVLGKLNSNNRRGK